MSRGHYERGLVTALDACGYGVMRAPASGAATDRDMPDVLAGRNSDPTQYSPTLSDALAIELKATKSTTAYVDPEEITALQRFASRFGATPLVGVKFKRPGGARSGFWLVPPNEARMTDSGRYGFPESDIGERAVKVVLPATGSESAEVRAL